jgi:hypothetical protein
MAIGNMNGQTFAAILDRAIAASCKALKQIELKADTEPDDGR